MIYCDNNEDIDVKRYVLIFDKAIVTCLNSVPDDILSMANVSVENLAHVGNIILAYQYGSILCKENTLSDDLCKYNKLLKSTLIRINLHELIDLYTLIYEYYNNSDKAPESVESLIRDNYMVLSENIDVIKCFIFNIYHPKLLLE